MIEHRAGRCSGRTPLRPESGKRNGAEDGPCKGRYQAGSSSTFLFVVPGACLTAILAREKKARNPGSDLLCHELLVVTKRPVVSCRMTRWSEPGSDQEGHVAPFPLPCKRCSCRSVVPGTKRVTSEKQCPLMAFQRKQEQRQDKGARSQPVQANALLVLRWLSKKGGAEVTKRLKSVLILHFRDVNTGQRRSLNAREVVTLMCTYCSPEFLIWCHNFYRWCRSSL